MKPLSLLIFLFISIYTFSQETEIYQWRGENRAGIFNETNLLKTWPENGPTEIWFNENIGNGFGSPTITDNEIFITGEIDGKCLLFCLNISGELKWKQEIGNDWTKSFPGSRSSPTIIGDLIYVGSGFGNLFCLNRNTGKIIWSKDFVTDFNGQYPLHGHSDAPVIYENIIFWTPGGKTNNVVALNRFSGEQIWRCKGMEERSAYTQSQLIKLPNRTVFITFSAYNLMGIDAETGKLLWVHKQDNTPVEERKLGNGDTHCNTPLFENGAVYYAAGDGNCGVKLFLSENGTNIKEEWRNAGFDSFMGGIIKVGNFLYGSGTAKKELKSINATTGIITNSLKIGSGAIIAADNMIYYYNQRGQLFLIRFENGKMKQESMFKITRGAQEHFSHPVIKNGILYQRHGNTLMAFDIRKN